MRHLKLAGAVLLLPLMLSGCAKEDEPEGVIPQGYKDAMGKADKVETTLQDAAERRMEGVDPGSE